MRCRWVLWRLLALLSCLRRPRDSVLKFGSGVRMRLGFWALRIETMILRTLPPVGDLPAIVAAAVFCGRHRLLLTVGCKCATDALNGCCSIALVAPGVSASVEAPCWSWGAPSSLVDYLYYVFFGVYMVEHGRGGEPAPGSSLRS